MPAFDDVYLQMQAHNLELVDGLLMDMEQNLLSEYIETESTPVQQALFVSAISQLWIFGVYELLRTWRQRSREVLTFGEEVQKLSERERKERISEKRRKFQEAAKFAYGSETHHVKSFERAANDQEFLNSVEMALYRVERVFRRIEALRMSLAKHELPKAKGSLAIGTGIWTD
ncbi:MAG: hypothetical protein L0387_15990 [Acidobacteria bacterium]|nr:hypothetical protein [Acidobacteriota bacterium]MCI0723970.1 hypothetical protein [Acidobacteriota bacterium]